jgi:hypothetical protein
VQFEETRIYFLSWIERFFISNGRPAKSIPKDGEKIVHPRDKSSFWIIGESGIYQVAGTQRVVAPLDLELVAKIRSFA